jgi:hypothetical protein
VSRGPGPALPGKGKRIAFVREYAPARIYARRVSGGRLRLLARGEDPDWSSTGALAFEAWAQPGIRVREPGGRVRTLTQSGADPSWAPAGDRLAFTIDTSLHVVNADGSGLRTVWEAAEQGEGASSPAWSPDGRSIAFVRYLDHGESTAGVYTIGTSGGGLRLLRRRLRHCRFCSSDPIISELAWQPLRRGS